jgi:hypothetical protein
MGQAPSWVCWRPRSERESLRAVLLRNDVLEAIRAGTVTLLFRRWQRPSVRAGGSQLTQLGKLSIRRVDEVQIERISAADAARAGYASREALLEELARREGGAVYRIELGALEPDPRVALRERPADGEENDALIARLTRLDARSRSGPWTRQTLELIERHPGVLAARLAARQGRETAPFKLDVRKLKALGLTESLDVGYRLSARGAALLAAWRTRAS